MPGKRVTFVLAVLLPMLLLAAQEQHPSIDTGSYEHVAQVYQVKPKLGMEQKFEDALKQHFTWLRQQNENWSWTTWQVMSGEDFGGYGIGTFDHRWKDFDTHAGLSKAERVHWNANVAPYTERITCTFYKGLPEVSFTTPQDPPPFYRAVKFVHVKLDSVAEFRLAMRKQQEAIVKTKGLPGSEWYQMVRGALHPLYVWVIPMKSMAELEPEPGANRPEMVIQAFGRQEGEAILTQLNKTVESYHGEIFLIRPELGYVSHSP